ncbi:HNH endonuclease signature motif containing protein [Actinomadura macrotermitis]|uniref:HNH endonuclease signature motif containing protein n=1 Tax=Actinomadura macrotermitis TaxID=2585200 RepID=UPI00188695C5|nr:HNH endonuclease signature motif containing protein [Actinomadura macrotermitis]
MITRAAVLEALAEFDRLGRDAFLETYGYDPARRYVLVHEGARYDSKAVVGVAHKYAAGRALEAREFSGGIATVGRLLERLGFEVVVDADDPAARIVARVEALRVASTKDGPARHQPILLLWAMGRARHRLPRLVPWSEARAELTGLLRAHGLPGSRPRPDYPFLALHGTHLWELRSSGEPPRAHGDAALLRWLDEHDPQGGLTGWAYEAVAGSRRVRDAAVAALAGRFFGGADVSALLADVRLGGDGGGRARDAGEEYRRLVAVVEEGERRGDDTRTSKRSPGESPARSRAAREAVLIRSGGRCENPRCGGQPADVTVDGRPILEVDHIDDRAGWGRDHPVLMAALCPNCHAVKTRGRSGPELREALRAEARERHGVWAELAPGVWLSADLI